MAAKNQQIDVFTKATYEPGSLDMRAPIKKIVDSKFCLVTVVFAGKLQDVSSLLLEAHRQNYTGEWVMPDGDNVYVGPIVNYMKKHLDEASIQRSMRGTFKHVYFPNTGFFYSHHWDMLHVREMIDTQILKKTISHH